MKAFRLNTEIKLMDTCKEFFEAFDVNSKDLIITSSHTFKDYLEPLNTTAKVIFLRDYGKGEPTDIMVEKIYSDIKDLDYKRVIAIGGGSILDVSKLFVLKNISPVLDLFDHKLPFIKDKELVLIPTTCGTGSEVTNISILELTQRHTKFGLAVDELFADTAVLIPELLSNLPFEFFATSSIDAFVHAIESYLSPKATPFSQTFSIKAMEMILNGYKIIASEGKEARLPLLNDFLIASTYAGIAFGNAGTGAVHAMSYPLGGNFHVPHGEANYAMFTGVFEKYQELEPNGKISDLNDFLSNILKCSKDSIYQSLELLFNNLVAKKRLSEYGMTEQQIGEFTTSVMTTQGRLMANNYTTLDSEAVYSIYKKLF